MFGDAFLARSVDDGNERFERLDFVQTEFSPSAEWIVLAKKKKVQIDELNTDPGKGIPKQTMAPRKPPSEAQIATWKKQMDGWVDGSESPSFLLPAFSFSLFLGAGETLLAQWRCMSNRMAMRW